MMRVSRILTVTYARSLYWYRLKIGININNNNNSNSKTARVLTLIPTNETPDC
jgi:hypothetical protein